jgi:CubicO group peptidase (beta-lactamase class C family)
LKFEVGLLGVMIFLIGGILALIAVDPSQIQESPSGGLSQPQIGDEISVSVTKQPVRITTDINKLNGLNWLKPENRNLGFRNMDKLVPFPHEISKGSGPVHEFGSDPNDLSNITVEYFDEIITLEEYLQRSHTDAILVLRGNDIVYEEYFRMDPNERHSIQSVSKTIVPAVLGNYVQDESVDLDKKMKEYFPDIGSGYAEATLQQVLDMDVSNNYDGNFDDLNSDAYRYEIAAGFKPDIENKWPDGHRGYIKSFTSDDVSSTGVSQYQDPNTDIGAWILEDITGEKYYELFEEKIYQHLGAEQDAMIVLDNQGNAFAAGGWQMTLRDLARYASVWMNEGVAPDGERVIPAEWIDELRDPNKGVAYKGYEELNIRYHNQMTSGGPFVAHAGWGGQFMYADPDNKVAYVIFSSLVNPEGQTTEDLRTMYEFGLAISEYFSQ